MSLRTNRLGEENYNKYGTLMKIIEYNRSDNIVVEFQDEYKYRVKTTYDYFKKGGLINPYDKNIYGVGFIGEEIKTYKYSKTEEYKHWYAMMRRVYNNKQLELKPSYEYVNVCEEWHNYTQFKKWYDDNYYQIDNQIMEIDKDILQKGNKIYCPEKCIFVPHEINSLFIKRDRGRGDLPIGVTYKKKNKKYCSNCNMHINGKVVYKHLGLFNTPEEAFNAYKKQKEQYIKEVADEYKDRIPQKLYEAMYRYEVEITD